jgi:hypothetical protein
MIAPLAWMDLMPIALTVWLPALALALLQMFRTRQLGKATPHSLLAALFTLLSFGSLFSIFGVAQILYFHGSISLGMEIFIGALAAICSAASAMNVRYSIPAKAM